MTGYLKRLVRSLAAYQVADVVSKFIAVLLLPVYTRYINPAGYGVVELLGNGVIFISILVRFGMIEAFLRYHFTDADQTRRDALARRAVGFLLVATTIAAAILAAARAPLSKLVLGHRDPTIFLIAVLGLWAFTNLELAYALLRVDERMRAYAAASLINVGHDDRRLGGARGRCSATGRAGLLLGNYGASTVVLLGLWWTMRHRLLPRHGVGAERLGVLLRFGLPTVPAEASVYALSIVDRYYIYHDAQPDAGRPLLDRGQARRRGRVHRPRVPVRVAAARLLGHRRRRGGAAVRTRDDLLRARQRLGRRRAGAARPVGPAAARRARRTSTPTGRCRGSSLGWAMYGLWVVFLVIAGRAKVTTRNFPAALAGLVANVVLLVLLVPPLGIAGAGIALCGAYVVMLAVMHLLTRRAFTVGVRVAAAARSWRW